MYTLTSPVNQTSKRPTSSMLLLTTGINDTNLAAISAVTFDASSAIATKHNIRKCINDNVNCIQWRAH